MQTRKQRFREARQRGRDVGHFSNGRGEIRVMFRFILHRFEQGAKDSDTRRRCDSAASQASTSERAQRLAWHQGLTVPAEVPLNGADSSEVVHTVKEGLSGGHAPRSRACCSRLAMA